MLNLLFPLVVCSIQSYPLKQSDVTASTLNIELTYSGRDTIPPGSSKDFIAGYHAAINFKRDENMINSEAARIERSLKLLNAVPGSKRKPMELKNILSANEKKAIEQKLRRI